MADPVFVDIPKGAWKKVATNVVGGAIHKKTEDPNEYLQMYKETGGAAPSSVEDGVLMFKDHPVSEEIKHAVGVDVYIWAVNNAGRVRVDL